MSSPDTCPITPSHLHVIHCTQNRLITCIKIISPVRNNFSQTQACFDHYRILELKTYCSRSTTPSPDKQSPLLPSLRFLEALNLISSPKSSSLGLIFCYSGCSRFLTMFLQIALATKVEDPWDSSTCNRVCNRAAGRKGTSQSKLAARSGPSDLRNAPLKTVGLRPKLSRSGGTQVHLQLVLIQSEPHDCDCDDLRPSD